MKHLPVSSCRAGWLCPLFPYFILKVSHPIAVARSWCPKHIPNIGFIRFDSFPISNIFSTFWICFTVSLHILGSPGPLLKNRPSYFVGSNGWFHGTTSMRAFLLIKQRSWLYLSPQSTAHILGPVPSGLRIFTFYKKLKDHMWVSNWVFEWLIIISELIQS